MQQRSSQNESTITILGSVICGVLITLLLINWMSRRNKEVVQSILFEKQAMQVSQNSNNTSSNNSELLMTLKLERLQMENELLKKEINSLKQSPSQSDQKSVIIMSPTNNQNQDNYQVQKMQDKLSLFKDNVDNKFEMLVEKINSLSASRNNSDNAQLDLLIQELKSIKQDIANLKNTKTALQTSNNPTSMETVYPKNYETGSPNNNQIQVAPNNTVQQPKVNNQVVQPVRRQAVLDVRNDLGPDPQDIKPKYKNDELK